MRKIFQMNYIETIKNDFKTILTKNSLRYGLKCGILSGIFAAIWIYKDIPMGFWAVYSAYIVMQNHTGGTLKRGFLRISGHILITIFSTLYAVAFIHGYLLLSIVPVIVGYFILGYLIAGSDNVRYAGISGGAGFGIMLFEHPLDQLTLHVVFMRATIIITCAIIGVFFDHFVMPVKTSDIFKDQLQKILSSLSAAIKMFRQKEFSSLDKQLNEISILIYQTSKQITDFSLFQRSRKKDIYLEILNSLKQMFYDFKKYKLLLDEKEVHVMNEQIEKNELEMLLFIENKFIELENKFVVFYTNTNLVENNDADVLNLKNQISELRNQHWYKAVNIEQRINFYSRVVNLFHIANEAQFCSHIMNDHFKTKDLHKMRQIS